MDKDRLKGKMDELKGKAKRQVGEWTGNRQGQAQGSMEEIKGAAQDSLGQMKDKARNLKHDLERGVNRKDRDVESDRDHKAA